MDNSSEGKAGQRNEQRDAGEQLNDTDMSNNSSSGAGESTLTPVFNTFNITDSSNHTSGTSTSQPANRFINSSSSQTVQDVRNSTALATHTDGRAATILPNGRHPLPPSRPHGSIGRRLLTDSNRFIPHSIRQSAAQSGHSALIGAILSSGGGSNGAPNLINTAPLRFAPFARPSMSSASTNAPTQAIHNAAGSSISSSAGPRFGVLRQTENNTASMANTNAAAAAASPSTFPILGTTTPSTQGINLGKRKQDDRGDDKDSTMTDSRRERRVKLEETEDEDMMVYDEKAEAQPTLPGEEVKMVIEKERKLRMKAQEVADKDDKRIAQHLEKQKQIVDSHIPSKEEARKARIEKGISSMSDKEFLLNFGVTRASLEEKENKLDKALEMRDQASKEQIAACGIELDPETLPKLVIEPGKTMIVEKRTIPPKRQERRDFFNSLLFTPEIIFELCKFLRPRDFLSLYAISKDFHEAVQGHMSSVMVAAAKTQAPDSARVFPFRFYADYCVDDPTGRPHPRYPDRVRKVPGLKWLQMIVHREKTVRDILALLARQGHRTPKDMPLSIKKMWLLMDVATSAQRVQLFHSKWFTDFDLWNMQLFFVKLDMMFNHPIRGPGHDGLRKLMLGQRGLTPLCKLLKREIGTSKLELSIMDMRYAWQVLPEHRGLSAFGIPAEEIGIGHLEGWGKGRVHLIRPDELVMRESVRRGLNLKTHIMSMMLWGYVDPITVKDTPPTEAEMYMSDDAEDPDKGLHWVHPETFKNYVQQHEESDDEKMDGTEEDRHPVW